MVKGYVNSVETFGALDGPGIRIVVFMQGCSLGCAYCHNADMIKIGAGKEYSEDELLKEALRYKPYMDASKGGITISGGEPLIQYRFVYNLLKKCKAEDIHTAVDTYCYADKKVIKKISKVCDLFIVCVKQFLKQKELVPAEYDTNKVLSNVLYLSNGLNKPVILRHVLIPKYTDQKEELYKLVVFAKKLKNLQFIEVLPYHRLGEHKWGSLKRKKFDVPSKEDIIKCTEFIRKNGVEARFNS